ncbi:hypothetical protein SESBI_13726 [Sesbania bispinosa]|nr:hypothetical protein SESBI_13726 [Sesbania bispinosa]
MADSSLATNDNQKTENATLKDFQPPKQEQRIYICGRGKLGYLTRERLELDITNPQHVVWDAENSLVMTWLIYELTLQAREIWQGGDNVTRYFHSLKQVWQDLDLFNTYKWKSTEDAKHHKKTVEEGRIFQFLAGLNEDLDEVHGRIIGRETLSSPCEVFTEVRREKTRKSLMMGKTKVDPTPPMTNPLVVEAAAFKSSTNQKNFSNLWCDHYNKPRHTRETC